MKWLAVALIVLAALLGTTAASATTTCSITGVTGVAFGAVDPTGTQVDTTATLSYSCTYSGGLLGGLYGVYVTACASLGPDDLANIAPRTMINANSDRMQYQLYKDTNRTAIWGVLGNATYTPLTYNQNFTILSNGQAQTGTLTIYGRVPAAQASLSPGSYTGTIAGSLTGTSLTYRYNEVLLSLGTYPATCQSAGTSGGSTVAGPSTTVTASVAAKCTFGTATDMQFGSVSGLLKTVTDQTSLLRVTCTNRAAYQIGLNNGANASGTIRRMSSGTGFVTYELYRDTQRTLRWGGTLNTDTVTGTGAGSEQTLNVYGRVPVQTAARAGSYSDVITVTVTY